MKRSNERRDARPRVVYFPVHNVDYPRNRLIRSYLADADMDCIVLDRGHGGFAKATWRRKLGATFALFRACRGADIVILSELSNQYAALGWLAARIGGCLFVVDGFVGLYETRVEDWQKYPPSSLRARALQMLDRLAYRLPEIFLTDTDVRARNAMHAFGGNTSALSLPVGAPDWAVPNPNRVRASRGRGIELLHYGNYAPLHGAETIIAALAELRARGVQSHLTIIGEGERREGVEAHARETGVLENCTFVGRIPESQLLPELWKCDIMLGIFGESPKAASVIPNKVWQGLAAGTQVITRVSDALDEIAPLVGDQLNTVPPADPAALATMIQDVAGAEAMNYSHTNELMSDYVDVSFRRFTSMLHQRASPTASRRAGRN